MKNRGKHFEEAVHRFSESLDPNAEILFDHRVTDKDTGTSRQCDVWINALFKGHWPLSILVSCKDWKRKLHIGDMGKFLNEIRSTGASLGVIYSRKGFTQPAIQKAKANGVSCCRLYQNEPADIPEIVIFRQFVCSPSIRIDLMSEIDCETISTWDHLFDLIVEYRGQKLELIDLISNAFHEGEEQSVSKPDDGTGLIPDWHCDLEASMEDSSSTVVVRVAGAWRYFKAEVEATLLEGSYVVDDGLFSGSQIGPAVDLKGSHPGEAWEELDKTDLILPSPRLVFILHHGDTIGTLRTKMGPKPIA